MCTLVQYQEKKKDILSSEETHKEKYAEYIYNTIHVIKARDKKN